MRFTGYVEAMSLQTRLRLSTMDGAKMRRGLPGNAVGRAGIGRMPKPRLPTEGITHALALPCAPQMGSGYCSGFAGSLQEL